MTLTHQQFQITGLIGKATICLVFMSMGCGKGTVSREELSSVNLLRGDIALCGGDQFGDVDFLVACSPKSQPSFKLGMALLHSFEYEEAEKAFVKVLDTDPNCVMAYWGVAMSNFHSLWMQSGSDYLEKGSDMLKIAEKLPKSEREKDYLNAIGAFYNDWQQADRATRIAKFQEQMEALYQKYSDDKEAAVFYALALTASANPADKTYKNQRKAGEILESIFPNEPNHPGIAHYIIHAYDYPELASLALPTARKYAQIAPSSAHAQHMPSHIFTRLGLWNESINSNINSVASAQCYAKTIDATAHWDEELHGMDYLVYAYLQTGDNIKANEEFAYLNKINKVFPENFKVAYTVAAIPARLALENKDWKRATQLELPGIEISWTNFPWEKAIFHFASGIGFARTGDIVRAKVELDTLNSLHEKLMAMKDPYEANQVHIQIKAVEAWIQFASGNKDLAISMMQESSQMEANTSKHPVTPCEVVPANELLGDMLFESGKYAEALAAYQWDLEQHPNRLNGLYGAAVSAHALKKDKQAEEYFYTILKQSSPNSTRKEIAEARQYLDLHKGS